MEKFDKRRHSEPQVVIDMLLKQIGRQASTIHEKNELIKKLTIPAIGTRKSIFSAGRPPSKKVKETLEQYGFGKHVTNPKEYQRAGWIGKDILQKVVKAIIAVGAKSGSFELVSYDKKGANVLHKMVITKELLDGEKESEKDDKED